MQERTKDWIGRGIVGAVVATAMVLAGCGEGERATRRGTSPRLPRTLDVRPAAVVTDAPAVSPESVEVVSGPVTYETAEAAWREGRYGDAVALFTRYVAERPGNPWGHYMLGLAARRAGDLAVAEQALRAALAVDPDHVKSLINLSRVLREADRPAEALAAADSARTVDPASADAYRQRGLALSDLGRAARAIDAYRLALLRDPADAWSANNLGLLHIRGGRYAEAVGPLALAVTLAGDIAVFRNNLGVALERTGHLGQAAEQYGLAAERGHARAGVSRARMAPLVSGDEPMVDLALAGEAFLAGLQPAATIPGESAALSRLWERVLGR